MRIKDSCHDKHVGNQLRLRRIMLGLSQADIGNQVGLTFQQIQKYERGANRIGAGRLYQFANILSVTISYFFEGLSNETRGQISRTSAFAAEIGGTENALESTETASLLRHYYRIENTETRIKIRQTIQAIADIVSPWPAEKPRRGRPRKRFDLNTNKIPYAKTTEKT